VPSSKIKNVVLIVLDTLGANYVGAYGANWIKTPNIDRLARMGALFENAYSEGLPTIPCRRAMMTGRYTLPSKGWGPLEQDDTTIADILWGKDIQTALIYDTAPMRLPKYGYSRGFDYVRFCYGHELDMDRFKDTPLDPSLKAEDFIAKNQVFKENGEFIDPGSKMLLTEVEGVLKQRQNWCGDHENWAGVVGREAIRWLEDIRDATKPFFMWMDSFDPHEPWDPPSVWKKEPCPYDPEWEGPPIVQAPWTDMKGRISEREAQHIRALHAEKVTLADKWVGKVLDKIRSLGLWDDTLIILTSDHGQPMGHGEHGHGIMRKCRPWPYEEVVHVPLIIQMPGGRPGQRIKGFTQSCDIAPTVLDALGCLGSTDSGSASHEAVKGASVEDIQGFSLLPLVTGEKERVRDFAIAGYYSNSWSIITGDYSYIHWLNELAAKKGGEGDTDAELTKKSGTPGWHVRQMSGKSKTTDDMWTCTPGAEVILPESDELYDRLKDPFQLNNIIHEKPEKGKELLQSLKLFIGELKTT
jgi:arylsulfatase A-like enzyme